VELVRDKSWGLTELFFYESLSTASCINLKHLSAAILFSNPITLFRKKVKSIQGSSRIASNVTGAEDINRCRNFILKHKLTQIYE